MKTDALGKRSRFASPQPFNQLVITDNDLAILETIQRHGPLPTNYIHAATGRRSYSDLQHRLTKLYNGSKREGSYLSRPASQFNSAYARYQPMIYDLAPPAERVLAERGKLHRYSPKRTDHFLHRFMTACVSLSFELECRSRQLTYLSLEDILQDPRCLNRALAISVSRFTGKDSLVPDGLFGIRYEPMVYRFFVVEIDRRTESIERKMPGQSAFRDKLRCYFEILDSRRYRTHWGLPNLKVIIVTTNATHADNILKRVHERPDLAHRFLIQSHDQFDKQWCVPRAILPMLSCAWKRAGEEPMDLSKTQ